MFEIPFTYLVQIEVLRRVLSIPEEYLKGLLCLSVRMHETSRERINLHEICSDHHAT
jgi:hypothetical protein